MNKAINWNACINEDKVKEAATIYVNKIILIKQTAELAGYPVDNDGAMEWMSKMRDIDRLKFGITPSEYKTMKTMHVIHKM